VPADYWKAFAAAGFTVVGFEEPRLTEDRDHLAGGEKTLRNSKMRPYSVAFKLQKPPARKSAVAGVGDPITPDDPGQEHQQRMGSSDGDGREVDGS
jgi:hypothetical protein